MFQGTTVGKAFSKVRRLAAIVIVGGLCLTAAAGPVSAQSLTGGGKIYGAADCRLATKTANVSVTVMEPSAYANSGLYFYTQVWAKARHETKYNLIGAGTSPLIKTWSRYNDILGGGWVNNPTRIFSASFTGSVETHYDIHVMWWSALPGATQWTGPYSFNLRGDPDSSITLISNVGYGDLGSPASDCYL